MVTVLLEAMLPKQRIFELYLNVIEWGDGVFGAEAAAQRYFGVSAAQLSAEQAAQARRDDAQPAACSSAGRIPPISTDASRRYSRGCLRRRALKQCPRG